MNNLSNKGSSDVNEIKSDYISSSNSHELNMDKSVDIYRGYGYRIGERYQFLSRCFVFERYHFLGRCFVFAVKQLLDPEQSPKPFYIHTHYLL